MAIRREKVKAKGREKNQQDLLQLGKIPRRDTAG